MPDITMCHGEGCPLKTHCYRFTAPVKHWGQAYFAHLPFKVDSCSRYVRDTRDGKVNDDVQSNKE
jgi:hypothetical protein